MYERVRVMFQLAVKFVGVGSTCIVERLELVVLSLETYFVVQFHSVGQPLSRVSGRFTWASSLLSSSSFPPSSSPSATRSWSLPSGLSHTSSPHPQTTPHQPKVRCSQILIYIIYNIFLSENLSLERPSRIQLPESGQEPKHYSTLRGIYGTRLPPFQATLRGNG